MTERVNKTVKIGKCVCICKDVPEDWTDEELHHYAWMKLVSMNLEKAKKEVVTERFRHAG